MKKTLYFTLLTIAYCLNNITSMPTTVTTKSKDDDEKITDKTKTDHSTMHTQKLDGIKKDFLQKLGMENRPGAITKNQDIPQALLDEFYNDVQRHEKEFWDKKESSIKKVIVEARSYDQCKDDAKCIQFKYSPKAASTEITNMNLWVYQNPRQKNPVVTLTVVNSDGKTQEQVLLLSRLRSSQKGWASITIEQPSKWLSLPKKTSGQQEDKSAGTSNPSIDLIIKVECTGCHIRTKGMKLPLLEFQETSRLNRRQRRSSTQCHKGGKSESCCLDDFTINFKDIGWDDWIISPKSYNRKICRGECERTHTGLNEHASIMKLLSAKNNNKLKQCCTPQRYEPLFILYQKEDKIVKQEIPNMVVAECGCA